MNQQIRRGVALRIRYIAVACILVLLTIGTLDGSTIFFIHSIDLVFHEAGHVIFGMLGETMGLLGGTLMQALVPLVLFGYFTIHRKDLAQAVMFWWFGENLVDISIYMADAAARQLPLLGGSAVIHDWFYIFSKFGIIAYHDSIARYTLGLGVLCMAVAIIWLIYRSSDSLKKMVNIARKT